MPSLCSAEWLERLPLKVLVLKPHCTFYLKDMKIDFFLVKCAEMAFKNTLTIFRQKKNHLIMETFLVTLYKKNSVIYFLLKVAFETIHRGT